MRLCKVLPVVKRGRPDMQVGRQGGWRLFGEERGAGDVRIAKEHQTSMSTNLLTPDSTR